MNWKQTRRTENNIDRLYPSRLVEEDRKTVRGLYNTLRWRRFKEPDPGGVAAAIEGVLWSRSDAGCESQ